MPDPIEELSSFDPGASVNPLPAAEVRRRGDRLRRRRNLALVGGAVAAVLLVAVPIAVFAGGDGAKPQPAPPGLTDEVLLTADEVPPRERLTEWRQDDQEGEVLACAPEPISSLGADSSVRRDFAADLAEGPPGELPASIVRTTVLEFDDDAAARDGYDTALAWVLDCPGAENINRDASEWKVEITGDGLGEWRQRIYPAPEFCGGSDCDAAWFDRMGVAQFGNRLVLVSLAEVGGPLEPEGLDRTMDVLFAAAITKAGGEITGGTAKGGETRAPEQRPSELEDFPLAAGWPDRWEPGQGNGLKGPSSTLRRFAYDSCSGDGDTTLSIPAPHRLRARWQNVEDYRTRELIAFGDADEAVAFMGQADSFYGACPRQDRGDGYTRVTTIRETQVGGQSFAVVRTSEYLDAPAVGMEVLHFIRLGRAVLIDTATNEGGAGPDADGDIQRQIEEQTTGTAEVVAGMCEFTEAGC